LYYAVPYAVLSPGSSEDAYWVAGFSWTIAWMAVSLLLLRRAGSLVAGPLAGKLAALLSLLAPFGLYYSYGISAEPPAYMGGIFFVYGWARWKASGANASIRAPGILPACFGLGAMVLARPNLALVLMLAIGLGVFWMFSSGSLGRRRDAAFAILTGIVATGLAMIFAIGVEALPKGRPNTSRLLAHVAFHGSFQYRAEPWNWSFWRSETRKGSVDWADWSRELESLKEEAAASGQPLSDLQTQWIIRDFQQEPLTRLQIMAVRTLSLHFWLGSSTLPASFKLGPLVGPFGYWIFHAALNAANLVIIVAALWFIVSRGSRLWAEWPLWGSWLALLAFHVVIYSEPRYLIPSRPGVTVMAAVVLAPPLSRLLGRWTTPSPS
jgi:hypothetical protein